MISIERLFENYLFRSLLLYYILIDNNMANNLNADQLLSNGNKLIN